MTSTVDRPADTELLTLPELAMTAFADLGNRTSPRMPLVSELTALPKAAYDGRERDAH